MPAATVCVNLSCLHISSYKNTFLGGGTHRAKFGTLEIVGGDNYNGGDRSRPTAWERGERGGIW